jgi:CubicO group peptidase (beta-lactamase class C family)
MRQALLKVLLLIGCAFAPIIGISGARAEPPGLHETMDALARDQSFSGSVVVVGQEGIRFARGYGLADPFEGRAFTPDTPVDSASLAKPITAAAILALAQDGRIKLDSPVQHYLPEFPQAETLVGDLLAHSAGLDMDDSAQGVAGRTNAMLLRDSPDPLFPPGTGFAYCNLCSITLALLIERETGTHYLEFVRSRVALPEGVGLRPRSLGDWSGRAIGHRTADDGRLERFDSWDDELLYGAANFSISALQLAQWGSQWWKPSLEPLRSVATEPARIGERYSGLTLGNWYCAPTGLRCHYLGHHEGFHHMLYWDSDRQVSVAMVSNNTLDPAIVQRLQRSIIAFVNGDPDQARSELRNPLAGQDVPEGKYELPTGEIVEIVPRGELKSVLRGGVEYAAYPVGSNIRYVPGLDLHVTGTADGRLRWLTLYQDSTGSPAD